MQILKDTQKQIDELPILVRWVLYVGVAIGLWKTIPWLFDAIVVVMAAALFVWCILGVSSDSYNALITSLNEAKKKIVEDLASSLKEEAK
jgi:hypothetical protein